VHRRRDDGNFNVNVRGFMVMMVDDWLRGRIVKWNLRHGGWGRYLLVDKDRFVLV
jgi:hypothetical protein